MSNIFYVCVFIAYVAMSYTWFRFYFFIHSKIFLNIRINNRKFLNWCVAWIWAGVCVATILPIMFFPVWLNVKIEYQTTSNSRLIFVLVGVTVMTITMFYAHKWQKTSSPELFGRKNK